MPRFYLPPTAVRGSTFTLSGSEAHHALQVLRKKIGDEIDLFDGKDAAFTGRIESIESGEIRGTLIEKPASTPMPVQIRLFQALTRGSKWEWLVEKACEVGVDTLIPVISQRTLIKLETKQIADKVQRWNRIALAASKQSGRTKLMQVDHPVALAQALTGLTASDLSLIPWEKESARTIHHACEKYQGSIVNVFIGPEGGWDAAEIELAGRHQVVPVRLGPTLLRTETAGLISVTLVLREFGVY